MASYKLQYTFFRKALVFTWVLCLGLAAAAQTFTTTVSHTKIGKKEFVELSYDVTDGNLENLSVPVFKDWQVASGPNNSSYTSNVNGTVTRRTSTSYYLQPLKTGKLVIDGAKAVINGKAFTSNSVKVEVVEKNVGAQSGNNSDPLSSLLADPFAAPGQAQQIPDFPSAVQEQTPDFSDAQVLMPSENVNKKIADNLVLRIETSKNACYEGEPIIATYKMYARVDVEVNFAKRPSFSGFSAFDLDDAEQTYTIGELNGKKYKVYTIRKVQLYPLQNGILTLDPVELECKVRFAKYENVLRGNFDPYNNANFEQVQYALKSPAQNITVTALPEAGRPADFAGAVGDFTIKAQTSAAETGKGDATTLKVMISGSGNFSMVHAPKLQWPQGMESYDPEEKENLYNNTTPISGDKTFTYIFTAQQPGRFNIPPVKFSYFDITTKTYKTIETPAMPIIVATESKRPKQTLERGATNWPAMFVSMAKYVLPLLAVVLVGYLLFAFAGRKRKTGEAAEKKQRDDEWQRMINEPLVPVQANTSANVNAEPPQVTNEQKYMPAFITPLAGETPEPANDEPESFTEKKIFPKAEAALWIADHRIFFQALKADLLEAVAGFTHSAATDKYGLLQALREKGVDNNELQQLNSLIDECDASLYSPGFDGADRQQILAEARFLFKAIHEKK